MDFDPTLLRAFVAVHEAGGFTRAAQRLHLTQSAVSHQIRRLEEQLGRQLVRRTTRSLALTEEGEEFLRYAMRVLSALDEMTARFRGSSPAAGAVRLGVPDGYIGHALPALLREFAGSHPAIRLDVVVGTYLELRSMVAAQELDLAIVACAPGDQEGTPLRPMEFVWAAARGFKLPGSGPLPLAFAPAPCINRQIGTTALAGSAIKWRIAFTSPNMRGLRAAAQAALAITVLTREEVEGELDIAKGQFGLPPLPAATLTLIGSARRSSRAVAALADLIRATSSDDWRKRPRAFDKRTDARRSARKAI